MFEYLKGKLAELNPTYAVIDIGGAGYFVNISLHSYTKLQALTDHNCTIFIHQIVREDAHILFGFSEKNERNLFRHLISVSGIGANTARTMLSSINPKEIQQAILGGDVNTLKSVKGIGLKTAQRIILDLKDKLGKIDESTEIFISKDNTIKEEALSALIALGFPKKTVEKAVSRILTKQQKEEITVEEVVKKVLKQL